jgi:hypothetical protein
MFDLDKWQEILNSIRRHKLRTTLTALGVFWGIFMLVLLLGAGNGLQNGVEHMFRDDATNSIWIRRGVTSEEYKGLPKGRRIQFFNDDYDYLVKNVKEVEHITGRLYLSGDRTVTYGDKNLSFSIRSVHPGHKFLENTIMIKGRYLNETDLKEVRKVAVIGKIVKESLFGEEEAIGKEINVVNRTREIGINRQRTTEMRPAQFHAAEVRWTESGRTTTNNQQLKCAPRNFMPLKSGGLKMAGDICDDSETQVAYRIDGSWCLLGDLYAGLCLGYGQGAGERRHAWIWRAV